MSSGHSTRLPSQASSPRDDGACQGVTKHYQQKEPTRGLARAGAGRHRPGRASTNPPPAGRAGAPPGERRRGGGRAARPDGQAAGSCAKRFPGCKLLLTHARRDLPEVIPARKLIVTSLLTPPPPPAHAKTIFCRKGHRPWGGEHTVQHVDAGTIELCTGNMTF